MSKQRRAGAFASMAQIRRKCVGVRIPNPLAAIKFRNVFQDVINYARLRGIRVLPEFDTPGHMKSWGAGTKGLLATCYRPNGTIYEGFENVLDPTNSITWDILSTLFEVPRSSFQQNRFFIFFS